jgi:predicted DNA-binding transcriptional regulator AlpA
MTASDFVEEHPRDDREDHDRYIRYHDLKDHGVPYSRQHLDVLERCSGFPARIRLSPRVVVWRLSEIREWIASRSGRR